jgi:hypothetical protein
VFSRVVLNEHVRPRCYDGRIDESKEEEAANKRANGVVLGIGILSFGETADLFANPSNTVRGFI